MTFSASTAAALITSEVAETSPSAAAAVLHHPNIVAIHEVGIHEDRHFFVMDYVEGPSLAQGISDLRFRICDSYRESIAECINLRSSINFNLLLKLFQKYLAVYKYFV